MTLQDGLFLHLPFNQSYRGADLSGYENPSNPQGGVSFGASSPLGAAAQYDGVDDQTPVPATEEYDGFTEFTATLWVYSRQAEQADYSWALQKGAFSGSPFYFSMEDASAGNWRISDGSDPANVNMPVNHEEWFHGAVVFDGSVPEIYGYRDGDVVESLTPSFSQLASNSDAIGAGMLGGDYFKGRLADVRLYNRALSQDEIRELVGMNAQRLWRI